MSNESWRKKFEAWNPEYDIKKYNAVNSKKKCEGFKISDNGLCKHYMGCPIINRTCSEECDYQIGKSM